MSKIMEKFLEPYERSVFIRIKNWVFEKELYDFENDGIFAQDEFIYKNY